MLRERDEFWRHRLLVELGLCNESGHEPLAPRGGCEGQAKLHANDLGYQSAQEFQFLQSGQRVCHGLQRAGSVRPGLCRREFHRHLRLRGGRVSTCHQCWLCRTLRPSQGSSGVAKVGELPCEGASGSGCLLDAPGRPLHGASRESGGRLSPRPGSATESEILPWMAAKLQGKDVDLELHILDGTKVQLLGCHRGVAHPRLCAQRAGNQRKTAAVP
mmetsp:Transcript_63871/g.101515  ORF Transcript_63871/g.101515 Transcript_63871/m.101515 type:complete len:216 (+) Transcript_63871:191-838(+)